jgi:hypothetical protein
MKLSTIVVTMTCFIFSDFSVFFHTVHRKFCPIDSYHHLRRTISSVLIPTFFSRQAHLFFLSFDFSTNLMILKQIVSDLIFCVGTNRSVIFITMTQSLNSNLFNAYQLNILALVSNIVWNLFTDHSLTWY